MRTKPKIKGKSTTALVDARSIEHLDPNSATHELDRIRSREYRQSINRLELLMIEIPEKHKYQSLGGGFCLDPDGNEETGGEFKLRTEKQKETRSIYFASELRKNGSIYHRPRPSQNHIRQIAITLRPDHSLAFGRLDHEGKNIKKPVKELAMHVARSFEKETGYEVLGVQIHPREGALHFHITFATVTENGRLIHGKGVVGRPGPRMLSHGFIGALRLGENGWIDDGRVVRAKEKRIERRRDGKNSPDWSMSELLDGLVEWRAQKSGPEILKVFQQAFVDYGEATKRADAQDFGRQLYERDLKIRRLEKEIERLNGLLHIKPAAKSASLTTEATKPSPSNRKPASAVAAQPPATTPGPVYSKNPTLPGQTSAYRATTLLQPQKTDPQGFDFDR